MSSDPASTPELVELRRTRAQEEMVRRWIHRFAPAALAIVALAAFESHPHPDVSGRGLVAAFGLGGFLVGLIGLWATIQQRSARWRAVSILVLITGSVALTWVQSGGPGAVGVLIGFAFLGRLLSGRVGIGLVIAAFVSLAVVDSVRGTGPNIWYLATVGGFVGMMVLALRLASANEQAERLVVELQASRAGEARAARLAERQRLAREMHDVLAHSLSGLLLQLEGARMLAAESPNDDPRLPHAIDRAHHLAKSGLDEARRAIGMLRDDELPGPERLAALAQQFETDRGVPCQLTVDGEAQKLRPETQLAIYRVAQEALTNIIKHASPERVELFLAYEPGGVRLSIEDFASPNGAHPTTTTDGDGYGLTGMRERAELLGGNLITEPTCSGFRVQLDVPA